MRVLLLLAIGAAGRMVQRDELSPRPVVKAQAFSAASVPLRAAVAEARAPAPVASSSLDLRPSSLVNAETKLKVLSLAAALDRGQSYNPTSSDAYEGRMSIMRSLLKELVAASPPLPDTLEAIDGEWELVFTDVAHGIFRSSPFFLAIQQAYADAGEKDKAELFFRLHELQTCSWGISKIGRVAQTIDAAKGMLYSEFDTNLLSLTTIPVIGFWKLLPTFGGSVITASTVALVGDRLEMEVKYTSSRPVPGLSGLRPLPGEWGKRIAEWIWNLRVPVGGAWELLPWNKGPPKCGVKLVYFDGDMRIVEDVGGEYFVYTRPVAPRPLEGAQFE
jgi:hypothetical protein